MMKNIAVIGAGANGLATAAWLTLQGHQVTLCDTADQLKETAAVQEGGIRVDGAFGAPENPIVPSLITDEIGKAVQQAEIILICVSAQRQESIGRLVCPALENGQTVLFNPGNLGAVRFIRLRPELSAMPELCLAELSGCLWACRVTESNQVRVALPLSAKRLAAYPAAKTSVACQRAASLFPVLPATNVLEATLNSPNVITHLCGTIFNVAQIEQRGEEFAFFQHGMSESVVRAFVMLEKERNQVLGAAGLQIYEESSENFMRTLMDKGIAPHLDLFRALKGPSSMTHRYITEDASCGVALLISLAKWYQVPVPLTESFLTIASALNGCDYAKQGATLENLGLLSSLMTQKHDH